MADNDHGETRELGDAHQGQDATEAHSDETEDIQKLLANIVKKTEEMEKRLEHILRAARGLSDGDTEN